MLHSRESGVCEQLAPDELVETKLKQGGLEKSG